MHTDNITYIKPTSSNSEPNITLNDILAEINTWRTTKISRSEKIPAAIWNQIFILAESIAESKILTTLRITKEQFNQKKLERDSIQSSNHAVEHNNSQSITFCEVKQAPQIPLAYKPAESFTTKTSVVEIRRPDGMLMKIHLCTDRFEELLSAFFKG